MSSSPEGLRHTWANIHLERLIVALRSAGEWSYQERYLLAFFLGNLVAKAEIGYTVEALQDQVRQPRWVVERALRRLGAMQLIEEQEGVWRVAKTFAYLRGPSDAHRQSAATQRRWYRGKLAQLAAGVDE